LGSTKEDDPESKEGVDPQWWTTNIKEMPEGIMIGDGWYVEKCQIPVVYYPTDIKHPQYYLWNKLLDLQDYIFGPTVIDYIPELYSQLKLRSLNLPRDQLQHNQLRATAVQILNQKGINPTRVHDAVMGSITRAMIPDDNELQCIRIQRSDAACVRKSLISGEGEASIRWRRVASYSAYVLIVIHLRYVLRICKYIFWLLGAFTKGFYRKYSTQILIFLQSMQTKAAFRMSTIV